MHYLRNQTENYCAKAKHTEQERGREREMGGAGGRCVRQGGSCGYACVNRKEAGKREGGFTCIDALLDSKKEDGYLYKYI